MNALDLAIIAIAIGAGLGGWRLGFVARVFAWAGVFTGLAIGVNFVPKVVTGLGGNSVDDRIGVALLFLFLVASIGQAFGLMVGLLVHRVFPIADPLPLWDKIAGASGRRARPARPGLAGHPGAGHRAGLAGAPGARVRGWSRRSSGSRPSQPAQSAAWGLAISDAPYPSALDPLDTPPDPGEVPTTKLAPAVDARRAPLDRQGDRRGVQSDPGRKRLGRGARDSRHERARRGGGAVDERDRRRPGCRDVRSSSSSIRCATSRCCPFPSLPAPPLPIATGVVGDEGAVYGHPGGGSLQAAPARIGEEIVAVGTNIYRTVDESAARIRARVRARRPAIREARSSTSAANVVGVAFAIDPGRSGTSYALTNEEVRPTLAAAANNAVAVADTGSCLVE